MPTVDYSVPCVARQAKNCGLLVVPGAPRGVAGRLSAARRLIALAVRVLGRRPTFQPPLLVKRIGKQLKAATRVPRARSASTCAWRLPWPWSVRGSGPGSRTDARQACLRLGREELAVRWRQAGRGRQRICSGRMPGPIRVRNRYAALRRRRARHLEKPRDRCGVFRTSFRESYRSRAGAASGKKLRGPLSGPVNGWLANGPERLQPCLVRPSTPAQRKVMPWC
jgi:hypothetical protein